nr:pyruvate, phosphate dikinase [Anaerolineaceae bacterium]
MSQKQWVYLFNEIQKVEKNLNNDWDSVRGLLGGKGANLGEMVRIGLPVPPGFVVSTEACIRYQEKQQFPEGQWEQMLECLNKVEKDTGKKFGSAKNPLLVSCRSGAKFSMPGMMDTVLNIGLNDETAKSMIKLTNNERFVYDSYRRLIQMFGSVVLEIPDEDFEKHLDGVKQVRGYKLDTEMTSTDLLGLIEVYKKVILEKKGFEFPQDTLEQLKLATEAVFKSWNGKRAVDY